MQSTCEVWSTSSQTKDNKEPLAAMFERRWSAMAAEHLVVRLLPQSNSPTGFAPLQLPTATQKKGTKKARMRPFRALNGFKGIRLTLLE
jgi:hypothetical protein